SGDGVGRGTARQLGSHVVHHARIPGPSNTGDLAVLHADVGLHDADDRVEHGDVGDHEIERSGCARELVVHAHAVAQCLSTAVANLVTVASTVFFDLDVEIGIGEPDLVADRGAVEIRVLLSRYLRHDEAPLAVRFASGLRLATFAAVAKAVMPRS